MDERDRSRVPENPDKDADDLGGFRGVVLDATETVETVSEPPDEPAQPPSPPGDPAGPR